MRASANQVANLIISRRKQLGLSQKQVYDQLPFKGSQPQFLSNVERGKCSLPAKHIRKISEVLQIEPEVMIDAFVSDYKRLVLNEVQNELTSINQPS
jgi:transcriptional regulator with XRE-family HTH domain